jgi:hypothetical protein
MAEYNPKASFNYDSSHMPTVSLQAVVVTDAVAVIIIWLVRCFVNVW